MAHDEPDFDGWCARVRAGAPGALSRRGADGDVAGRDARQPQGRRARWWWNRLQVGAGRSRRGARSSRWCRNSAPGLRNIDTAACAAKGVKVLTIRRRANISCAEHAFGLMLMLARKLDDRRAASSRRHAHQGRGHAAAGRSTAATRRAATTRASAARARSTVRPSASLASARSGARLRCAPRPSACACSITSARARPRPRSAN